MYNFQVSWPTWLHQASQMSHLLTVFSNSINFYIYLVKHGRRELMEATTSTQSRSNSVKLPNFPLPAVEHGSAV